jgi:flavin reductase ActVB
VGGGAPGAAGRLVTRPDLQALGPGWTVATAHPVPARALTEAMSQVPGPVSIVTTRDREGRPWGFTASALCSLSVEPPLVLVCLDRRSGSHPVFMLADGFLVNVLADEHAELARSFGSRSGPAKFDGAGLVDAEHDLPAVPGAVARLLCARHMVFDGGDHSIIVGRVVSTVRTSAAPLVYWNRLFGTPAPLADTA